MNTALVSKDKPTCPRCGKTTVVMDHGTRRYRCTSCNLSGFEPVEAVDSSIPNDDDPILIDWRRYVDEDGNDAEEVIGYVIDVLSDDETPTLEFDETKSGFIRFRLEALSDRERRHGRETLRKQRANPRPADALPLGLEQSLYIAEKYTL